MLIYNGDLELIIGFIFQKNDNQANSEKGEV